MPSVCLDAGHGGKDSGATMGSRYEKTDVLNMVLKVGALLEKAGAKVYYTRKSDFYESPTAKANKANKYGADFFASFHRNAANGSAKGYETLVYSNGGKAKTCADLANAAMKNLGFVNRGTKIRKELAVLNTTRMEAVLFEIGFIDNAGDNSIFDNKFNEIALELAAAIAKTIGVEFKGSKPTAAKPAVKKLIQAPGRAKNLVGLRYATHMSDVGTLAFVRDGQISGLPGSGKQVEAFWIDTESLRKVKGYEKVIINVVAHIQSIGDKAFRNVKVGTKIGTTGEAKRLEGFVIQVKNFPADKNLKFQVYDPEKGWTSVAFVSNGLGAFRGTIGESKRIEAIRMWIS